jgi:hypothetical protein
MKSAGKGGFKKKQDEASADPTHYNMFVIPQRLDAKYQYIFLLVRVKYVYTVVM